MRTGEIEQQSEKGKQKVIASPSSRMYLNYAYTINDEDPQSSVEVETTFSIVENEFKLIVKSIIQTIDEDFSNHVTNQTKKYDQIKSFNTSKEFLRNTSIFYFFFILQRCRMPHFLNKVIADTPKRVELICKFAEKSNSHKKFNKRINQHLKEHGFKNYPDMQSVSLEVYNQLANAEKAYPLLLELVDKTTSFTELNETINPYLGEHGIKTNPFSSFTQRDYEHYKIYKDRLFLTLKLIKETESLKEFDEKIDSYLEEYEVNPYIFHTFHNITQKTYDDYKQEIQRLILLTQRIHKTISVEEYNQYSNDLNVTEQEYDLLEKIKKIDLSLLEQLSSIRLFSQFTKNINSTIKKKKITTNLFQDFTEKEFNRIKDIVNLYRSFLDIIKQANSYKDYLEKFNQHLLAKVLTQEEYNNYKKINDLYSHLLMMYINQLRNNTLFSSFSSNNKDFSIKNLLGIKAIQELFNEKDYKKFCERFYKLMQSNESNQSKSNIIPYINDVINLLFRKKEILVSKDPVFVLPMVVFPEECNNPTLYIPLSPKIVIKFEMINNGAQENIYFPQPKPVKPEQIIEANKQFIEQTRLLKDHSIYKELSICIPCKLDDFDDFKANYLPKDIDLKV